MMGRHPPGQETLFYTNIILEERVRNNHPLRRINELIDFEFIYKEVKDKYGSKGNVSVPPPVILKLMLLLVFYNVRSERELMETVPERIDWLWFLGYNFDSEIPDHSVLSKARKRWGQETFKSFFERIVFQCVEAGLVDGQKIFMDASLIDADASNNSVIDTASLKRYLHRGYQELEKRLEEKENTELTDTNYVVNSRYVSTTDPDASIVRNGGKAKLRYKTHRAVDSLREVITAVEVTTGAVDEGHKMLPLIEINEANTGIKVDTVVADSKYGTKENFLICNDKGINGHMPILKNSSANTASRKGIFPEEKFIYDKQTDTFTCPAGKILKRRTLHENKQNVEYAASKKDCSSCLLKSQCTNCKTGRSLQRHVRHDDLNGMFAAAQTPQAKRDIKTRQHLMERSFARSVRFNFDRSRWRGLWKVNIQEYLVSTIQNIQTMIWNIPSPKKKALALPYIKETKGKLYILFYGLFVHRTEYWGDCYGA